MSEKSNNFAFIDSQNLNLAIREQGWILDFKRFRVYLKDKYKVSKAFIFIGYVSTNESIYTFLQKEGYILIFKPTLYLPNRKVKGNVDAELVLHTMIEFNNFYKAVIVTGDGDFYCLAKYLKDNNKLERLLIPNVYKFSSLLRRFNPYYMNNLKAKLEYRGVT